MFKKLLTCLVVALLLLGAGDRVFAQTWINTTSGNWTTGSNWNGGAAPGSSSSSVVNIDNASATGNVTVSLDLTGIAFSVGDLNLASTSAAGYTTTLELTSSSTSTSNNSFYFSELYSSSSPGLVLGSTTGTVELKLRPTVAGGYITLSGYSGCPGLVLNTGGLLTLDGSVGTVNYAVSTPVTINGGTLSVLGSSAAGGITSTSTKALVLSSGSITFDKNAASTTGRLAVAGNFSATGGSIIGNHYSGSANIIELSGASNTLSGVTIVNAQNLAFSFRGTTDQSLVSDVDLPGITMRNGKINTVTLSSTNKNVGQITFTNTANTTFKMGSNMNTTLAPLFTNGATTSTLDLNGNTLNVNTGAQWSVGSLNANFTSSSGTGTVKAYSYSLGNTHVGNNVIVETTGGGGAVTQLGTATIDAASTLLFSGTSDSASSVSLQPGSAGQSVGNVQIGTGTSSTYVMINNNAVSMAGNLSILTGSTLNLNGRVHTLSGALQGAGTIKVTAGSGLYMNSTGGISPGFGTNGLGVGAIGSLAVSSTITGTLITLNNSSVSYFDLGGDGISDTFAAGGNNLLLDGTLMINLINGYTPGTVGQTWTLFTGLGSGTSGMFDSVLSTSFGTFDFSISNGNGILTLTSVPEPSSWILLLAALPVWGWRRMRRKMALA